MDVAQRGDVGENIIYITLKLLGIEIFEGSKNSDDRGLDFVSIIDGVYHNIQVKSVYKSKTREIGDSLSYDLNGKNYNKLVKINNLNHSYEAGLLLLVVLNGNENDFINITPEQFEAKCKIYWYKPKGEETENETIAVHIPFENQITTENLNNHKEKWKQ